MVSRKMLPIVFQYRRRLSYGPLLRSLLPFVLLTVIGCDVDSSTNNAQAANPTVTETPKNQPIKAKQASHPVSVIGAWRGTSEVQLKPEYAAKIKNLSAKEKSSLHLKTGCGLIFKSDGTYTETTPNGKPDANGDRGNWTQDGMQLTLISSNTTFPDSSGDNKLALKMLLAISKDGKELTGEAIGPSYGSSAIRVHRK